MTLDRTLTDLKATSYSDLESYSFEGLCALLSCVPLHPLQQMPLKLLAVFTIKGINKNVKDNSPINVYMELSLFNVIYLYGISLQSLLHN